LGGIEYAVGKK